MIFVIEEAENNWFNLVGYRMFKTRKEADEYILTKGSYGKKYHIVDTFQTVQLKNVNVELEIVNKNNA